MKVSCYVLRCFLLLVLFNNVRGEYRYKIRGPPPPPPPPKPLQPRPPVLHFGNKPFSQASTYFPTKTKWPLSLPPSSGHRIVPGLRGTQNFQFVQPGTHYLWNGPHHGLSQLPPNHHGSRPQFQFKGPNLILPTATKHPSSLGHSFRIPGLKEPFLPSPPSEYDYQLPKLSLSLPQPPVVSHIGNAIDDDKGPIHTIPAPNLSPNSNLNHNAYIQQQQQHDLSFAKPVPVHLPQTQVTIQQSHGYEVREPSNDQAGHNIDGVPTYYAPDPDPSLPAPKIPTTTDPHSLPSNGKVPVANFQLQQPHQVQTLQILDTNGGLSNHLSSQELFELFHTAQQPQQQLVDSYGVPLHQQPQLQQHYHQQTAHFPQSNYLSQGGHDNADTLKTIQGQFSPDYQSFNYEEQYKSSGSQVGEYQEQEGSENVPAVTVVRQSPEDTLTSYENQYKNEQKANSLAEDSAYYNAGAGVIDSDNNSENYEESGDVGNQNDPKSPTSYFAQIDDGNGALSSSYYTTLPNREAAETLATLAAAGSINTHLVNHLRNGEEADKTPAPENTQPEEEEEEEEYEDEEELERPEVTAAPPSTHPPLITKPIIYQRQKESDIRGSSRYPNDALRQHYQRRPTKPIRDEVNEDSESVDYDNDNDSQGTRQRETEVTHENVNTQQKPSNAQFGARIRPKRNK